MSGFKIDYPPGATPLDPDERQGLIPNYITTQAELNKHEKENILEATEWALGKIHKDYLNASFCINLHKRMFSNVWKWAGVQRNTEKSIGVPKAQIHTKLQSLFEDAKYWIENGTYGFDEIAARFHHRLVLIHLFPNGNGRHARLMTEIIQMANGEDLFTWGSADLTSANKARENYLSALRDADKGKYETLLKFVRS